MRPTWSNNQSAHSGVNWLGVLQSKESMGNEEYSTSCATCKAYSWSLAVSDVALSLVGGVFSSSLSSLDLLEVVAVGTLWQPFFPRPGPMHCCTSVLDGRVNWCSPALTIPGPLLVGCDMGAVKEILLFNGGGDVNRLLGTFWVVVGSGFGGNLCILLFPMFSDLLHCIAVFSFFV